MPTMHVVVAALVIVLASQPARADCNRVCEAIHRDETGCCPAIKKGKPVPKVTISRAVSSSLAEVIEPFLESVKWAAFYNNGGKCEAFQADLRSGTELLYLAARWAGGRDIDKLKPFNGAELDKLRTGIDILLKVVEGTKCKLDPRMLANAVDALALSTIQIEQAGFVMKKSDLKTPQPLTVNAQRQLRVLDLYLKTPSANPVRTTGFKFYKAKIYLWFAQHDIAIPLLLEVIDLHPKSDEAEYSANLVLDHYEKTGKKAELVKLAEKLIANTALMTDREELSKTLEKILREGRKSKN
jgi:hypothetical protein